MKTYPFYLLAGFKSQRSKWNRKGNDLIRGWTHTWVGLGPDESGRVSVGKSGKATRPLGQHHVPQLGCMCSRGEGNRLSRRWVSAHVAKRKRKSLSIYKSFYKGKPIWIQMKFKLQTVPIHKIKSKRAHEHKIKIMQRLEMQQTIYITPILILTYWYKVLKFSKF
jgi:hypothetical protein